MGAREPEPAGGAAAARALWAALLAAALGGLLIGGLAGWWLARPPGEGSGEVAFARDMSAHHEQAVELALIIRDRTADPALRTLADDIVLTQQNQIGQMTGWLAAWGLPFAGATPPMGGMGQMMGMAPQADVNALRDLPVAEAEVRFLQLMVTHHEGGVHMAAAALESRPRAAVARLAESIVAGQRSEIEVLVALLAARGAERPPPLAPMSH